MSVDNVENPTNIGHKPKFPCRICKGDHLLNHFPGIPKVLEVWSMGSQQPMSPVTASHAGDNPSTNDHKVGGKKGKVRIPCRLCGEMHLTYLFPHMDEASQLLEDIVVSQKQPPVASHESSPNQPLVDEVVSLIQSSVDPTLPLESEVDTTQVFLVTSYSSRQGGISPISMEPPPSTEVISLDWNRLVEPHLPSCMPFQITVQVCDTIIHHTIVDEGTYVSILSSTAWKAMVSPQLVSVTHHLLDFNRRSSEPLGILPQLPITLGGKIVCIDVMVVQGPLEFNLLLGWDYVYAMKVFMSTLFRVMHFPHNGNIVTIDQLSFVSPDLTVDHPTSLNVPYMKVISLPPQVNYVVSCPMPSTSNEKEPLTVCSTSLDSDLVVDMVNSSMGDLEPDISPITPIESLDIHSFQSIVLPSDEDLLEAMVKVHEHSSLSVSSS
jgi:hypothetical protein